MHWSPVAAQTGEAASNGSDVYCNDLPETHEPVDLHVVSPESRDEVPADLQDAFAVASAGAVAAQQFGNLAASKRASGVVAISGIA